MAPIIADTNTAIGNDVQKKCLLCMASKSASKIKKARADGDELIVSSNTMRQMAEKTIELWYRETNYGDGAGLACERFVLTGPQGSGKSAYLKRLYAMINDENQSTSGSNKQRKYKRQNNIVCFIDFDENSLLAEWQKRLLEIKAQERTLVDFKLVIEELLFAQIASSCRFSLKKEKINEIAQKYNLFLWVDNWENLIDSLLCKDEKSYSPAEARDLTQAVIEICQTINETCCEYTRGGVCISISTELIGAIYTSDSLKDKYYNTTSFWKVEKNSREFLKEYIGKGDKLIEEDDGKYICDGCQNGEKNIFYWDDINKIVEELLTLIKKIPYFHPTKLIYALSHACGEGKKEDWEANVKKYYKSDSRKLLEGQLKLIYICCGEGSLSKEDYIQNAKEALMDGQTQICLTSYTREEWKERVDYRFRKKAVSKKIVEYLINAYILVKDQNDKYKINPFLGYIYSNKTLKECLGEE